MAAARLGAAARPLPVGADTWAALMDCASSTGAGGADLALPRDLASAAPAITNIAPAQTRTRARPLPTEMPVDEGRARSLRLVWTVRSGFLASGATLPE